MAGAASGSAGTGARIDRAMLIPGPLLVLAMIVIASSWAGTDEPSRSTDAVLILITSGMWALLWLASAAGFGWLLRKWIAPILVDGLLVQVGLGIAFLLFVDAALGRIGLLSVGGGAGAWCVTAPGLALLGVQIAKSRQSIAEIPAPNALIWTAAPAIAILLVAATSAPGWLWASEFGGYDALSYHLLLPREWLAAGRIAPLEHNVYSFLPGYVEAAYLHLAILTGDEIEFAYSCQLLHSGIAMLCAVSISRTAAHLLGRRLGPIAGVIAIGTPWLIVVGSLAYNEAAVALLLAVAMHLILEEKLSPIRLGIALGLLIGASCGARLTALGFIALPIALIAPIQLGLIRAIRVGLAAAIVTFCVLLPWLIGNWVNCGNPTFPFLTGLFGQAHSTVEQIDAWQRGHMPHMSVTERLSEIWRQLLCYGLGSNPYTSEPWQPLWSILPWLCIAGITAAMLVRETRRIAIMLGVMFVAQLAFWVCATHIKSRFMLPALVPASFAVALGFAVAMRSIAPRVSPGAVRIVAAPLLIAWSLVVVYVFTQQRDERPAAMIGATGFFTGDDFDESTRREAARIVSPDIAINHVLSVEARILLIGNATPFYIRDLSQITYQTTWDRGPMSDVMRQSDDPADWARRLRTPEAGGFTHVLVDFNMLQRWEQANWNDPLLTPDHVSLMTDQLNLWAAYPGGRALYEIPARP